MTLPFEQDNWFTLVKLNGEEFTDFYINVYGKRRGLFSLVEQSIRIDKKSIRDWYLAVDSHSLSHSKLWNEDDNEEGSNVDLNLKKELKNSFSSGKNPEFKKK